METNIITPQPVPPGPKSSPDWRISELYKQSWQILKKYKVLWIFGIAAAAGGGYSSSSHSNSSFDQQSWVNLQNFFQNSQQHSSHSASSGQVIHNLSMVLGASTNAASDTFTYLFSAVNPIIYLILGLEVLFLVCISIAISAIFSSWAEAGLLHGIQTAIGNGVVSIRDTSEKAFSCFLKILLVRIVPSLIFIIALIPVLMITIISILFLPLFVCLVLFIIFASLMLNFTTIWSVRKIVTEQTMAIQSLKDGFRIAKKKFWSMLLLGMLNFLLLMSIFFVIYLPALFFLILGIIISISTHTVALALFIWAFIFFIPAILISNIVSGLIKAFTTIVWSLAYQKIKGKYDKQ